MRIAAQTTVAEETISRPQLAPQFRLERLTVSGGAELLTIFASANDSTATTGNTSADIPLVSILRDTMGDRDTENDRLRYVWMLTYTRPAAWQRVAAAVPFLYARVGNKKRAGKGVPPPLIDLATADRDVWDRFFWIALQNLLFVPDGIPVRASLNTLRRNLNDYRKAHLIRALAVLSLYDSVGDHAPAFSPSEMSDINARLTLAESTFGGILDDVYLGLASQKQTKQQLDVRGQNWELLRQRAEAESLYFEPLQMPDGSATHAVLWASRNDLAANRSRTFNKRFLNIDNPWSDRRLQRWDGYSQTWYFDAENRRVSKETAGARPVAMIPLALYGLDYPKIPILLVDFRDRYNPKRREISKRLLEDVARNLLNISRFGDLYFFLGRTVYDFVTSRRGMDINQPSRLQAYSQLKLLLSLSQSLDPQLRAETSRRLEAVSANPLENDIKAETQIARDQYSALRLYALSPDGLPARIERDRRAEMVPLAHNRTEQILFRLAHLASFGLYTHREAASSAAAATQLDEARRIAYHTRFLREAVKAGPVVEVVRNIEDVRRSLQYIMEHNAAAGAKTARAVAQIFSRTNDEAARELCLNSLYRINTETAKSELLRIYRDEKTDTRLRTLSAQYLRKALKEEQRFAPADARALATTLVQ
ncbi:MAG: hypothetical protein H0V88_12000 [Pyrinomonadaceae bacterium]|nr:hypothetical protein [Pyrinomonadaceae bacterium]